MNIPTKPRSFVKTLFTKVGWVILGLLMPDLLLLIAVCELYAAIKLLRQAYRYIHDLPAPPNGWIYSSILLRDICHSYEYKVTDL